MSWQLGINIGFITNSSSVVFHFPKTLLADPGIAAFLKAFEVEEGFVGRDLWHRGECGTLAIHKDQKKLAQAMLRESEYCSAPEIAVDDDKTFVLIYGDEYHDLAATLLGMLKDLMEKQGLPRVEGHDYN
jgi:hypothetical protein